MDAMSQQDVKIQRKEGEANAYHSYGEEKVHAFAEYINSVLAEDPHLSGTKLQIFPIRSGNFPGINCKMQTVSPHQSNFDRCTLKLMKNLNIVTAVFWNS